MINLNPFTWLESNDNKFKACFGNVDGINVDGNHVHSGNFFGYHPVKKDGVEIGFFNVNKVDKDCNTSFDIVVSKNFDIHDGAKLEIVGSENNGGYYNRYNVGYFNIIDGNSSVVMRDGDLFKFNQCDFEISPRI